ncbi:21.7 kDa class VI heat shock protein [Platanthera guangdongensis]|uniref:21.7 kDa class VI heat shock protein n=1 Tax=Platanthera guangdongensis TaxID=2320717 RepID=A0ABR2LW37_9ASPA
MSPRRRALEVRPEPRKAQKWRVPLYEDVFSSFLARGGETVRRIFGEGSLFSPLLFEKFFDPADAFPLWEFDPEALLLPGHSSAAKSAAINWSQSDNAYFFRSELPAGASNVNVEVALCGDKGRVIEISGKWEEKEAGGENWRNNQWWEHGFVRRLEVPDDADLMKMEACIADDVALEIKLSKNASNSHINDGEMKESGNV